MQDFIPFLTIKQDTIPIEVRPYSEDVIPVFKKTLFLASLLGAKYLMIGLLKGGFLLYRPISEQSSIKHVKKKGIPEEQIVTRSWIDVIIIYMKILENTNQK